MKGNKTEVQTSKYGIIVTTLILLRSVRQESYQWQIACIERYPSYCPYSTRQSSSNRYSAYKYYILCLYRFLTWQYCEYIEIAVLSLQQFIRLLYKQSK